MYACTFPVSYDLLKYPAQTNLRDTFTPDTLLHFFSEYTGTGIFCSRAEPEAKFRLFVSPQPAVTAVMFL